MIDTEKADTVVKLQIFKFDLPHFVENHLDTATSDVHKLRNTVVANGKLSCQMGFVVKDRLLQYQDDLTNAHFKIDLFLDYDANCLAIKPRYAYKFDKGISDRDLAIKLLNSYVSWLKQKIKQAERYAESLTFSKLMKDIVPSSAITRALDTSSGYRVDNVYTRKSVLNLILHNIPVYYKQMLNNEDIEYFNSKFYLYWLLTDMHLRKYFMFHLLAVPDLKGLIQSNPDLVETILQIYQFNFEDRNTYLLLRGKKLPQLETVFASVILPMLSPITSTLPNCPDTEPYYNWRNWEGYNYDNLKLLADLENYFHVSYFDFPLSFINDLAENNIGYSPMPHFKLLHNDDLDYLLSNWFEDRLDPKAATETNVISSHNREFTNNIIELLSKSEVDLNGKQQLVINRLNKLKQKSRHENLTDIEQNQVRILKFLLK